MKTNRPFRTPNGPKKFSVYVRNEQGSVVKVNFGDPNMEIKRDDPARRKSFRARHHCDSPGPKWKANYWSCKMWSAKPVRKILAMKSNPREFQTYAAWKSAAKKAGATTFSGDRDIDEGLIGPLRAPTGSVGEWNGETGYIDSPKSKPSRRNGAYDLVEVPKDGPGYLSDASINTKGWIDAKLGSALSVDWPSGEQPAWDNSPEILEYLEQREGREYKLEFRDNVYNSENDFNQVFTFSVYIPADSEDWIYEDGAYVALCLHKGGDTRGNYTFASLYKPREALGESGFTDFVLGWSVTDGKGDRIASADRYEVGYSNSPTSELNKFLSPGKDAKGLWSKGAFYFNSKATGKIVANPDVR